MRHTKQGAGRLDRTGWLIGIGAFSMLRWFCLCCLVGLPLKQEELSAVLVVGGILVGPPVLLLTHYRFQQPAGSDAWLAIGTTVAALVLAWGLIMTVGAWFFVSLI